MRAVRLALIAFAAVVLDAALAPEIEIAGARPDFLVMVVVYASLIMGARAATIVGFLLGLAADAEMPEYLGLNALALSATAYATSGLWSHLVRTNVFVQCLVLFAGSLLHDVIYYFFYYRNHLDMLGRFLVTLRYARRAVHGRVRRPRLPDRPHEELEGRRRWRAPLTVRGRRTHRPSAPGTSGSPLSSSSPSSW